jgi:hypothetical protein
MLGILEAADSGLEVGIGEDVSGGVEGFDMIGMKCETACLYTYDQRQSTSTNVRQRCWLTLVLAPADSLRLQVPWPQ